MVITPQLEKVAYAVGGALIGSTITYFSVKAHISRKYARVAEAEIDSVKEAYNRLVQMDKESETGFALKSWTPEPLEDEPYEDLVEVLDANGYSDTREDPKAEKEHGPQSKGYTKYSAYVEEEPEETKVVVSSESTLVYSNGMIEDEEREEEEIEVIRNPHETHMISMAEYEEDGPHVKMSVEYFAEDNTLVDGNGVPIPDSEMLNLLGPDFSNWFASEHNEDPNLLYVRNPKKQIDFEIALDDGAYLDSVGN